jgi:hypothetical protein
MRGRSRFSVDRYRRARLVELERRCEFLDSERRRLEWLLGSALEVAVGGTPTKPNALLGVLCELMPTDPSRAAMFQERTG